VADAQTAVRVKTALVNDPVVGAFVIEVHVLHSVVTLSGRVRSPSDVERAVSLARSVAGVSGVTEDLTIGAALPLKPSSQAEPVVPLSPELLELDPAPSLLALGGAFGWSVPRSEMLRTRMSISPLIKVGAPQGLSPTVAFDWFNADLESVGQSTTLTKVHVRPIMAGVGYTLTGRRFSLAPSIVGGYAFNSLSVTGRGDAEGLPVEVDNSFAWRVGASAWFDASRKVAVNASTGYVMTSFRLTVLESGQLRRYRASGDTFIVHLGVAYRVF
jgi:hypothetical protein